MVSKSLVCENDETAEDIEAGDNEVEEFAWFLGELKSVLGYRGTLSALGYPELWSSFDKTLTKKNVQKKKQKRTKLIYKSKQNKHKLTEYILGIT